MLHRLMVLALVASLAVISCASEGPIDKEGIRHRAGESAEKLSK